ncbi:hypothetical protein YH63_005315 [Afipia massiliensis]|uniref:Uncharacterized protein n=1 Tax=Afipia massiliensis TaxID=211460 RepID=A0A4U6BKV1_9BRAD|nr:hypothetical protein [Afipia massiliensis]TKT70876.1 hypothetical protein YH63_005315 [Afipia massiliensis]
MRSLTDFLAGLPGIMPIKTRRLVLQGGLLSAAERSDIHSRDRSLLDVVLEVGPDAAAAILIAYKDGHLPMKKGWKPAGAPEAEAYLARADEFRDQIDERRRRERAVKDPSLIAESDLTNHRLIDRVFIANIGTGSGSMVLAGIKVHKQVIGYRSNSGKSTGWFVRFDWTGSDGQKRHSETVPSEANNRRNDSDRGWGLHE